MDNFLSSLDVSRSLFELFDANYGDIQRHLSAHMPELSLSQAIDGCLLISRRNFLKEESGRITLIP
jgi:hypothetical protein